MMVAMANPPTSVMGREYNSPDDALCKSPTLINTEIVTSATEVLRIESETDTTVPDPSRLRPIIIDGSNVAMNHGNKRIYSCRGIKICVDWFVARGHQDITVFVPQWRTEESKEDTPIQDRHILYDLESRDQLVFTPSRKVTIHLDATADPNAQSQAKPPGSVKEHRVICYDDRYIVKVASEMGGIIVSNDNYRDLARESPTYARVIQDRLLMYTFVKDRFMPPDDPLGRNGPSLDEFLMLDPPTSTTPNKDLLIPICPYGPKCTYGNKCKFEHPERKTKMRKITKELVIQAQKEFEKYLNKDRSAPSNTGNKKALCRTYSLQNQPQASYGRTEKSQAQTNPNASESAFSSSRQAKNGPHHTRGGSLKNNETRRKPPPSYKLKHETSLPILDTLASLTLMNVPKKALGKTISDPYGQMLCYPRKPHLYPFYPPPISASFNMAVPAGMLAYTTGPAPSHCPTIPETWVYGPAPPSYTNNNNSSSVFNNHENLRPTFYNAFQTPHQSNARDTFTGTIPNMTPKAASLGHSIVPTSTELGGIDFGKCALEKKLSAPPFLHSDRRDPEPANVNSERGAFSAWTGHPNSVTNIAQNEEPDHGNNTIVSLPPNILSFLSEYESKTSTAPHNPWANVPITTSASTSYGNDPQQFDVELQNKRLTLYFHLASLFPEHHVKTVMNNHPDITDPRKLCSILLKM